jgi:hypothetical protein
MKKVCDKYGALLILDGTHVACSAAASAWMLIVE